jgi:uncharacterized caspase-like protein
MRYPTIVLSLILTLLTASTALADKRVAFVVGNGAYRNVAPLSSPPIDAKAMAAALRKVGFEVIEGTNLTRDSMTDKLLEFGNKAQGADIAIFYYAGHGIAISGTNYLLPIDADIKSEWEVKLGAAINIDLALDQAMGEAKAKLVFLDACRDNPVAARISVGQGLAEMKSGEDTLIAFAAGPGQTALDGSEGTDSPFTRALIAHITQPGVEIQQAMTEVRAQVSDETGKAQSPWSRTGLTRALYLNPVAAPAPNAVSLPPSSMAPALASTSDNSDVELEFWRSVKDSNNPEELNAYLTRYPNGQFRSLALTRLAALENGGSKDKNVTRNPTTVDPATFTEEADQISEDQIGFDRGKRREVQRRLIGLGFGTRVTGIFGRQTRSAIKRWQAARGYPASGFLNEPQHMALLSETVATTQTGSDGASADDRPPRHIRHSGGARGRDYRGGDNDDPGAFMGGATDGTKGGMFRY